MSGVFGTAADWLEFGRPGERAAVAEAVRWGELLWSGAGTRAYGRQDPEVYRLTVAGVGGVLAYEVVGVEGGWLR